MSINRADIERHLDDLTARAMPLYADPAPIEAFKSSAVEKLCEHFDKHGWPTDMPKFTVLPPSDKPVPLHGYAGFEVDGKSALWRMQSGTTIFEE